MDQMYLMSCEGMVMAAINYLITAVETDNLVINEDVDHFGLQDPIRQKYWVPMTNQALKDFLITGVCPFRVEDLRYQSPTEADTLVETRVPVALQPRTWKIEYEYDEKRKKTDMYVYDELSGSTDPIQTFVQSRRWGPIANDYRFETPCGGVIDDYLRFKGMERLADKVAHQEAEPGVIVYRATPASGAASAENYQRLDALIGFLQGPDPKTGYAKPGTAGAFNVKQHGRFSVLPLNYQVASRDFPARKLTFDIHAERAELAEKIAGLFGIQPGVLGYVPQKGGNVFGKANDREVDHKISDLTGFVRALADDLSYAMTEIWEIVHQERVRSYLTIRPRPDHTLIERMVERGVLDPGYAGDLQLKMIGIDPKHVKMNTERNKNIAKLRKQQQKLQGGGKGDGGPQQNKKARATDEEEESEEKKDSPDKEDKDTKKEEPKSKKNEDTGSKTKDENEDKKSPVAKKKDEKEESPKAKKKKDNESDSSSDDEDEKKSPRDKKETRKEEESDSSGEESAKKKKKKEESDSSSEDDESLKKKTKKHKSKTS